MAARVLVCDPLPATAIGAMRDAGLEVDERPGLTPDELRAILGGYEAAVVRSATKIRRAELEAPGRLKLIVRGGVGLDNIDTAAASERGIRVLNTPGASSVSVAELALGLLFALARRIPAADASVKGGAWEKKAYSRGLELEGKTLGILGLGRIGRSLARKARGIGFAAIVAHDKFADRLEPEPGCAFTTKDTLLRTADMISLHLPVEPGAPPEIGPEELARMKPGAFLVNTARGGLIDAEALLEVLESGRIGGAALDVFAEEPPKDLRLARHPRVICTPHMGAGTVEGQGRVGSEVAEILVRELAR